jgi:large subunit ribosomal protein L15
MQLHELKPIHLMRRSRRVGRGLTRGTYSGRGSKGQASRSGNTKKPIIRTLIKRYPKLRGYKFKSLQHKPAVIDLALLEKKFAADSVITPKALLEQKLIRRIEGRSPVVKILGKSKLTKKFTIEGCQVSQSAKASIEAAGGSVK